MTKHIGRVLLSDILMIATILSACAPVSPPTPTATLVPPSPIPTQTAAPTSTTAPSPASQPTPDTGSLSAKADAIFQSATTAGDFSGAVLIAQNGRVILSQGYGFADRETMTPNTSQTKFRIATLSQPFTAMAILLLQEQHKLTVQDSVCSYLPDCPAAWQPITLHHLLTHSAGLPDTADFASLPDQTIAKAKSRPLLFQPGARWSYSAIGYNLLGRIIEIVSGQSYEAFLQVNIFDPLQMSNTGYDHEQTDLALGYPGTGTTGAKLINPQGLFAAGALYSTVEDLYLWDQALYINDLVSQKALDSMSTGYFQNPHYPAGMKAGYGGYVLVLPTPPRLIEGTGYIDNFGYVSVVHRWLDDEITIIILANQQNASVWDLAALINKELFER